MEVAVSYLVSLYDTKTTIRKIEESNADYLHVDLMDGGFVPAKNFTIPEVIELLKNKTKPLDIHLMVFDPLIYIADLATLKPKYITFHLEATKDIVKTIELIKNNNIKAGLAINPTTDILELMPYLAIVDLVLIMSVTPGMGGQEFIPNSSEKVTELINLRESNNLNFKIEIDGGINDRTIKNIPNLDIIVSGSYICKSTNYNEKITILKN